MLKLAESFFFSEKLARNPARLSSPHEILGIVHDDLARFDLTPYEALECAFNTIDSTFTMTACEKVPGDFFQLEPGPSHANEVVRVCSDF